MVGNFATGALETVIVMMWRHCRHRLDHFRFIVTSGGKIGFAAEEVYLTIVLSQQF